MVLTCHLLHAVCSLSVSGTVAVLSRNALTLQFLATAEQRGESKEARCSSYHTQLGDTERCGLLQHEHAENKLSLAADGDFSVPVRLPDHKLHTDVSLRLSVELWSLTKTRLGSLKEQVTETHPTSD